MDDLKLADNLGYIGKECFVTFFEEFCNFSRSNEDVAAQIAVERSCSYDAALTWRVYPARNIIKAGRSKDALIICSTSRLAVHIKERAATLATRL